MFFQVANKICLQMKKGPKIALLNNILPTKTEFCQQNQNVVSGKFHFGNFERVKK